MQTITHKLNRKTLRQTALCLMVASVIALPGVSQAGWFSSSKPAQRVKAKVAATPGNITAKVADISRKLNEIYAQVGNSPIKDQVANGPVMNTVRASFDFVQQQQAEYQRFEPNAEAFRNELRRLFNDVVGITQDYPAFNLAGGAIDRVSDSLQLIDRAPAQFLFLMDKALRPQLPAMQKAVYQIHQKLAALPPLPTPDALMDDAYALQGTLCQFVTDPRTATHVATVQAILKTFIWMINSVKGLLPNDLTLQGTVVAGGGVTVSTHPAKIPFHVIGGVILEGIDLKISNTITIAKSVCQVSGHYNPS